MYTIQLFFFVVVVDLLELFAGSDSYCAEEETLLEIALNS